MIEGSGRCAPTANAVPSASSASTTRPPRSSGRRADRRGAAPRLDGQRRCGSTPRPGRAVPVPLRARRTRSGPPARSGQQPSRRGSSSFDWRFPGEPKSAVRFEIEPRGPGTVLVLDHRQLALESGASYSAGWHAHLDLLDAQLRRRARARTGPRVTPSFKPDYDRQAEELGWPGRQVVSPVRDALYRGDRAAAEALADGAELDVFDAAALGDTERLDTLLSAQPELLGALSEDGFTPLHLACFSGGAAAARLLIERGAPLERLAESSFARVRPLGTAAFSRDHASARALLEAGAEPSGTARGGSTPTPTPPRSTATATSCNCCSTTAPTETR